MEKIALITTGGTIDKIYGAGLGVQDLHIGHAKAVDILRKMGVDGVIGRHVALLQKDSLDITLEDRNSIGEICNRIPEQRILITHGTDTMLPTARHIGNILNLLFQKTIVITGALQPECMRDSDAEFNIGLALGTCLMAPPGMYIAIHGVHTNLTNCVKGEDGIFRS